MVLDSTEACLPVFCKVEEFVLTTGLRKENVPAIMKLLFLLPTLLFLAMVIVGCGGDTDPDIAATNAAATSIPIAAAESPGTTITCTLDAEHLRISCQAHGYGEASQLKWASTGSWADSAGSQWEFLIAKDLITSTTQVFLEDCQGSNCWTIQTSIDTSELVSKEVSVPVSTSPTKAENTATPPPEPAPTRTPLAPTPAHAQTVSTSTSEPQQILKLPFTTDDEPQMILPMGETILHDPPWGHPGIDFMWDHKPPPLIAAVAGEVGSIDVNNRYGGHDITVLTGEFFVTYHVFELYLLNPDIDVGDQITTGQVMGYPKDVSDQDDVHSTHWAFGTWEKLPEPITTPEGDVRTFMTSYLCPLPYFVDSEQARLSSIWKEARYPGDGKEKEQFPGICNGPYKNY